jgi:hypothetical protein
MMQLQCFFHPFSSRCNISKFYLPRLEVHNGRKWMQVQTSFGRSVFCTRFSQSCGVTFYMPVLIARIDRPGSQLFIRDKLQA